MASRSICSASTGLVQTQGGRAVAHPEARLGPGVVVVDPGADGIHVVADPPGSDHADRKHQRPPVRIATAPDMARAARDLRARQTSGEQPARRAAAAADQPHTDAHNVAAVVAVRTPDAIASPSMANGRCHGSGPSVGGS